MCEREVENFDIPNPLFHALFRIIIYAGRNELVGSEQLLISFIPKHIEQIHLWLYNWTGNDFQS